MDRDILLFCHLLVFDSFGDPMGWNCSSPGSSVHGIFQVRTLEQVAIPFSKDIPDSEIKPIRFFNTEPPGKPIRETCMEGNGAKTQGEDSHCQAKERGLRRHQCCLYLDLQLLGFRSVREKI